MAAGSWWCSEPPLSGGCLLVVDKGPGTEVQIDIVTEIDYLILHCSLNGPRGNMELGTLTLTAHGTWNTEWITKMECPRNWLDQFGTKPNIYYMYPWRNITLVLNMISAKDHHGTWFAQGPHKCCSSTVLKTMVRKTDFTSVKEDNWC